MPGHGNHWESLFDVEAYIAERMPRELNDGVVVGKNECMDVQNDTDRAEQVFCMRYGSEKLAHQFLIVSGETANSLFSLYPVILDGIKHQLTISKIEPWEYNLEGWIHATVFGDSLPFAFFDTMFWDGREKAQPGDVVEYSMAALAYTLRPIQMRVFEVKTGPFWEMEKQRRLEEGEPAEEAERPVEVHLTGASMFLPRDGEMCDEAQFQGVIEAVEKFEHEGQSIYRLEIIVAKPDDLEFRLPIYASEYVLDGYVPILGDDVEGLIWIQGAAC